MKAFLKDQLSFILFFYSQLCLVIFIAQLASYNANQPLSGGNIFYLFFLPSCMLVLYLFFQYMKWREFYSILEQKDKYSDGAWLPDPPNQVTDLVKSHYAYQYEVYRTQLEQLEEKQRLENTFTTQWVHQMKTPVSVMQLTLEKEKDQLPEAIRQSMEEEIERIRHGLDVALYQSRLQQFERDFHVEKMNLASMIREAITAFKSSFIRNHVYPAVAIDEAIYVYTDPKWFHFVLSQLTSNAMKYSAGSGEKITFRAATDGKTVQLSVIDAGVGIPKQDIKRVFDPFFTGENGRVFRESTGMGLYLSKQICDALEHGISISSEPQHGTNVTITFSNLTKM